jgi:PEP-CTERM motif
MSLASRLLGSCILCCAVALLAVPAHAAQFQFNTLVQLGEPLHNAPNGWEVGWGPNTGAPTQLGSLPTYWSSGASRQFQVIYDRPSNNMEVRVYNNGSSAFANAFYTPPGGPSPVNAVWRLPAASFFVTALAGGNVASSINVSNLSLTTPTGGALTILSPLSATSLTTNTGPGLPTKTVALSNDVVFLGDATGSWRLSGFVTMNFTGLTGSNYNRLQFGISALSDVPEPSTWAMMALGLALVGIGVRRRP